jgi:putative glycosyltransferase
MRLSIVSTLYNSAPHLIEFYERITQCAQDITHDYELILVNDGSSDNSFELAVSFHEKDQRVKVIDLSRNFGHHKAIMTGLSYAQSDYVFLIDSDLEEPPETLNLFWEEIHGSKGLDVVFGIQEKRRGGWFERISGSIFYGFINLISDIKIPRNFLTVRLMTARYTKNLIRCREREINFSTLTELTGFKQKAIPVKKGSRSPSNYSFLKKFSILVNAVTSSTIRPFWIIFYLGLVITLGSSVFILKLLIDRGVYGIGLQGWTSVVVSIFFFGGLIIFVLGILGIYLSKIFVESKNRPYTVIRELHGLKENSG